MKNHLFPIHDSVPMIEVILNRYKKDLGKDFIPYRNHVYRVFHFALIYADATDDPEGSAFQKIAVAAAFHDIGIWADHTWDYIQPSIVRASEFLVKKNHTDWVFDISFMISEHHKFSRCRGPFTHLADAFRKADWLDVMLFALPTRLPRSYLKDCLAVFPRMGFHRRLLELGSAWAKQHPFKPLPMMKF